jgi:DNA repair protein RecN (Recombination protein N)
VLEDVRITGLGVIADALLELHPGLTVLTGETGAGKTMVVHGLALLLGGRLDSSLVGAADGRAVVEGRVALPPDAPVLERVHDAGGELDEGSLLISRLMSSDGRSRCYAGGRAVPVGLLAEIAESLVAMHGQHDQQRLSRPATQRAALDRYAGAPVGEPLQAYREAYARLAEVVAELDQITTRRRERALEADALRLGLAEVEVVQPTPGEDAALAAEVARLAHAEQLRSAASDAAESLTGDPSGGREVDATSLVAAARAALASGLGHDPALDALGTRLAEVSYLLADVAADLSSYAAGIEADPARLEDLQQRQSALTALTRKYAADLAGVLAWAQEAGARLGELDHDDDRLSELESERTGLLATLSELAGQVSQARASAAAVLGARVSAELGELAMPDARLDVVVSQRDDEAGLALGGRRLAYSVEGVDDVELQLVAHAGAPARPVAKGASGGELSRVMLALEVVLAGADPVPTMVFDEVDAGVGGRAAVEVGRRLAMLARSHQVVVVTHLPQVAAFADRHLHVVKDSSGSVTRSGVTTLDDDGRLRELSRMLAGLEDSELARGHAEELLAAAATAKTQG